MRKLLITGAGGFIGSHLVELALKRGYKVKAFLRYNSRNNWGLLERVANTKNLEVVSGDIRDYDSVYSALEGCDSVFHLAALIGIPYSYVSPKAYISTNIEGTYNILESSRKQGVKNLLITSTSETYGSAQYVPIDEDHPAVGQSPYSASKIAADQLAVSYHRSFGLNIKIVRPFNTFGPRQSPRAIIPTIITQLVAGKKEIKLGSVYPLRDFVYVKDTALGFIEIAKSKALIGQAVNIGTNREISMGELALTIASLMKKKVKIVTEKKRVRPNKSEVNRLLCDNTKIKKYTDWKAHYTLEKGLEQTIRWYKKNPNFYKTNLYHV